MICVIIDDEKLNVCSEAILLMTSKCCHTRTEEVTTVNKRGRVGST